MIAAALLGLGCDSVLGIERRSYDPTLANKCDDSFDCKLGYFCTAGQCGTTPPNNEDCKLLEPTEDDDLGALDWQAENPLVIGTLFRVNNAGELPRLRSMQLAVREINGNGGVGKGRKLAMVVCDYGGSTGVAEGTKADSLILQGVDFLGPALGASVIIAGSSSSVTQKAIDRILAKKYPTAFISSFSTSTQLTNYLDKLDDSDKYGLLWRTAPDDTAQAAVLGRLIDAHDNISKVAIVYVDDTYGSPLQQGIKSKLDELGSDKTTSIHPFKDDVDFDKLMDEVFSQATKPDSMLFIGVDGNQVVEAYQALVDSNNDDLIKAHFLADAAKDAETLFDSQLSEGVKTIVKSAKGTAPYHSTKAVYDTFAANLKSAFEIEADNFSFLAQSYDMTYMAAFGLVFANAQDAARNGVKVAEGFAALVSGSKIAIGKGDWPTGLSTLTTGDLSDRTVDIDGTSGPMDFDVTTGNAPGPIEIWSANTGLTAFETCASCDPDDDECDLSKCL